MQSHDKQMLTSQIIEETEEYELYSTLKLNQLFNLSLVRISVVLDKRIHLLALFKKEYFDFL